jgi:hypothetical protein
MNGQRPHLNRIAYSVMVLTAITAFIHLYLSFQFPDGPDLVFMLNGIGYLALVGAIYAPIPALARYRSLVCWILIAYTALTIVLWLFFGADVWYAYIDKAVEVVLILATWLEARRFSHPQKG